MAAGKEMEKGEVEESWEKMSGNWAEEEGNISD